MKTLKELQNQENELCKELLSCDLRTEWDRHSKLLKKLIKNQKEQEPLIIAENKKNGVYWDREDWVYDMVKSIKQDFSVSGQERTRKFVEDLNKIHGCVVTELDAGYELEIFTPYKVYLYNFKRGYGDYPIRVSKGFIAPGGNTYRNKIFLAKSTQDMHDNYHNH